MTALISLAALLATQTVFAAADDCDVRARTTAGYVCGVRRITEGLQPFAAFLAVPYAKQPVGELRFKELQPAEPWTGNLNATQPGLICPQTDSLLGTVTKNMSEECIHANIYVPLEALPPNNQSLQVKELRLPVLVFVNGGGFAYGSGDPDSYGPEYLMTNKDVVITFNYRLNVFGFLSLNSTQIPGNNALRDIITLLRWVKDNAEYFGGNPDDITLAGQSAGGACVHLVTLSPEAQGLFNRAIILSGTAIGTFYTTSPAYAQYVANAFLQSLGINSTDPEEIHDLLVETPLENLMEVNKALQNTNGLVFFSPVIESAFTGVKTIIPEAPETLLAKGYGKNISLIIGFTDKEAETFRGRFTELDVVSQVNQNVLLMAPLAVTYSGDSDDVILEKAQKVANRYFHGENPTLDEYVQYYTDFCFHYAALKVAEYRSNTTEAAPTYMYQFSYNSTNNPLKIALNQSYTGAGHAVDLSYIFKRNSLAVKQDDTDNLVIRLMTRYVENFIYYDRPSDFWEPTTTNSVRYLNINSATNKTSSGLTADQLDLLSFYDSILAD